MTENEKKLRDALGQIAQLAKNALDVGAQPSSNGAAGPRITCTPKYLPARLAPQGIQNAMRVFSGNLPNVARIAALAATQPTRPGRLTINIGKYWGPSPRTLTVSFMEATPVELRARILGHMNAWTKTCCIGFAETSGQGEVRISRGPGGYWSYLGTDIQLIPADRPTMNLQDFTMNTPESEFIRVVRHEAGHTLGCEHEHMRRELVDLIDPEKAYEYFQRTQGWNRQEVDQQVLTALGAADIMGTPPDQTSIMCYQLPGSITYSGEPILGGVDINETDFAFIGQKYPKPSSTLPSSESRADWDLDFAAQQAL